MKNLFFFCAMAVAFLVFENLHLAGVYPADSYQGTLKRVPVQAGNFLRIDHQCHYPFNPSSILLIMIFFDDGVEYISSGEKRCAWHFAKELEAAVRDSILLPGDFRKKFLEEIRKAKKRFDNI